MKLDDGDSIVRVSVCIPGLADDEAPGQCR